MLSWLFVVRCRVAHLGQVAGRSCFGRCPAWMGAGHGQGALRSPAIGQHLPAREVPDRPPRLARRGAPSREVAKTA